MSETMDTTRETAAAEPAPAASKRPVPFTMEAMRGPDPLMQVRLDSMRRAGLGRL